MESSEDNRAALGSILLLCPMIPYKRREVMNCQSYFPVNKGDNLGRRKYRRKPGVGGTSL